MVVKIKPSPTVIVYGRALCTGRRKKMMFHIIIYVTWQAQAEDPTGQTAVCDQRIGPHIHIIIIIIATAKG